MYILWTILSKDSYPRIKKFIYIQVDICQQFTLANLSWS